MRLLGPLGVGCLLPGTGKGHLADEALPQPESASVLSLARFLRLHSPPVDANILWELLGMTCFKLAPPLDCAEGKG